MFSNKGFGYLELIHQVCLRPAIFSAVTTITDEKTYV